MSKLLNKKIITPLIIILLIGGLVLWSRLSSGIKTHPEKYEGFDLTQSDDGLSRDDTYTRYLQKDEHKNALSPKESIPVDLFNYSSNSTGVQKLAIGGEENVLQMDEKGTVEWKINVEKTGFYNIYFEYYTVKGRGINIERELRINGEVPFAGADALSFARVFTDNGAVKTDNQGNQIRPTQEEQESWLSVYATDATGYEISPYKFYFKKGENTISLIGISEPFAVRKIEINNQSETPIYTNYSRANSELLNKNVKMDTPIKIQGESAQRRSSPSLYATCDRSSGNTEPSSIGNTVLNKTGGNQWRVPGDWIEWDVDVPEDGAYVIGIKARQGFNRGVVASRKLMIDNEVPFEEVGQIKFAFNSTWKMNVLQDKNGVPYKIPLTKGRHTIRMEVTLGDFGEYLSALNDSVFNLNKIYRKILVITGSAPDRYRDYNIEGILPDVIKEMSLESKRLFKLIDDILAYTGETNQYISVAQTLANQLEKFADDAAEIPLALGNFKENISALGTTIQNMSESSLDIDYICIADGTSKIPEVNETGFDKVVHETQMFFNSFFSDAAALGDVYEGDEVLDVWIIAGRDQSTILKTMVDDTFTPKSGINVNVKLIDVATLLPAVVAGTGPDIALTVAQGEPVNYALRNAALDLTQFGDELTEALKEYPESSYESFKFNGGLYGLPETQNYNVLFYRTDICDELNIEIPNTWEDVLKILPVLQKSNMQIAIPSVERKIGNTTNPDLANYFAQLYQRGGRLYSDDATECFIGEAVGIEAFEFYTKLFTNYKLEKQYDFVNRFRSGEMPIGIADYNNFNTLAVFAPEINGLWEFSLVPGVMDEKTGQINRSVQSWGTASMILNNTKNKNKSWEFMKWWIHSDTQVRFGRELESIMGKSARYATANKVAFDQLSWGSKEAQALKEQWKWAFSIPEIAGGYYTSRHITNAIRKVMNDNEDPRETLLDYIKVINEEIDNKRKEFNFETRKTKK